MGPMEGIITMSILCSEITAKSSLMQFKSAKGFSALGQFGMLMLFFGLGMMLASILQWVMIMPLLPENTDMAAFSEAVQQVMKNQAYVNTFRWLQFLSTACIFFLPTLAFAFVCKSEPIQSLGFNKHVSIFQIMIAFLIMFTANLLADPLQNISKELITGFTSLQHIADSLENAYEDQVLMFSTMHTPWEWIVALFIMALLPAVFEEVFFRGALQNVLIEWWKRPVLAIIATSIIFSLIHSSIYLFLSRALLGFVLGWIYERTRNLWINIIAHFLNNALALGMMYAASKTSKAPSLQDTEFKVDTWLAIIAAFALFGLFKLLDKYTRLLR
jgi:membrane protease YdiL (CAAX protease family)